MTEKFIAAYVLLLGGIIYARQIVAKAAKELDNDLKAKLLDLALGRKWKQMVPSILLLILFFANIKWPLIPLYIATLIAFIALIGISSYKIIGHKKMLSEENFPDEYMRAYTKAMWVRQLAFAGFMLIMVWMSMK